MNKYEQWIFDNVDADVALGRCAAWTLEMNKAFPELRRVRGHYVCRVWGPREHWWLVAPDKSIVDPTASQFPTRGSCAYVTWQEGSKEPTGKCPECGEYCYGGSTFCCDEHAESYRAYVMGDRQL